MILTKVIFKLHRNTGIPVFKFDVEIITLQQNKDKFFFHFNQTITGINWLKQIQYVAQAYNI